MSQRRDARDAPCTELAQGEIERRMAAVRHDAEIARLVADEPGWSALADRLRVIGRRVGLHVVPRR